MCHIITISRRMNNGKTTEIQHEEVHILRWYLVPAVMTLFPE
jgi:hypothetical protein